MNKTVITHKNLQISYNVLYRRLNEKIYNFNGGYNVAIIGLPWSYCLW